eukprot:TRINITY_DN64603_c0_g1_i1.p1 TRINITY_DN64603_c0_g1~~TRINITY_DN64603_c0_g1_i1.p1  ORF type:complete len:487 (-),score=65.47 TRINITY_DN64603_c0_g1_i1:91-1551(-)
MTFTVVIQMGGCEEHAFPLGCFHDTTGLSVLKLKQRFSSKNNMFIDTTSLCEAHLNTCKDCPLGVACDEIHLKHTAAACCGLLCEPSDSFSEASPRYGATPFSPSYSTSACSSLFTPGPSEDSFSFDDEAAPEEDWDFVRRRLSFATSPSVGSELHSLHKVDTDYSSFDSDDSDDMAAHGWQEAPNTADPDCQDTASEPEFTFAFPAAPQNIAGATGDRTESGSDRDSYYSDFDSEDEGQWQSRGWACQPNTAQSASVGFGASPALDAAESDRDTDYSDFDSEDESQWQSRGWACQPNTSQSTTLGFGYSAPASLDAAAQYFYCEQALAAATARQVELDQESDRDSDYSDFDSDAEDFELAGKGWYTAPHTCAAAPTCSVYGSSNTLQSATEVQSESDRDSDYSDFDSEADDADLEGRGWYGAPNTGEWSEQPKANCMADLAEEDEQGPITPHSVREWAKLGVTEFRLNVNLLILKLQWHQLSHPD